MITNSKSALQSTISRCNINPLRYFSYHPYHFTARQIIANRIEIASKLDRTPAIFTSSSHQKRLCHAVKCYRNFNPHLHFSWTEISSTTMAIGYTLRGQKIFQPNEGPRRQFVVVTNTSSSDCRDTKPKMKKNARQFIPPKAAIKLTSRARIFCRELLENTSNPEIAGIMLRFQQSASGEPRMVFSFDFVKVGDLGKDNEG